MRVVVTGFGALTPIGSTKEELIKSMSDGRCAIDEITRYPIENREVTLAAELKNYKEDKEFSRKEINRLDKVNQYAILAAKNAMKDSKLSKEEIENKRVGVYISSGIGGIRTIEEDYVRGMNRGFDKLSPYFIPKAIINSVGANVAIELGAHGSCISMVTACASSTNAIGEAYRAIKDGYEEIIFAGGSEASITELGIGGFTSMKALSTSKDKNRASIPFDKDRNGFVMGEGAGVLVLESLDSALKRGANIIAELVGYGVNCDAYHITSPSPDAKFATKAIADAIKDAGISADEIDYINAHGTSTFLNDKLETLAIKNIFGDRKIKVSSSKSQMGHLLGGSGAVESILSILAMNEGFLPPLINFKNRDLECDLNFALEAEEYPINYFLKNSLGFGGHNAALIFKRY
ncbi:beta-ketoacyl-ACP synthase II [Anaerococcus sp. AGMB00486]|uniref:3-oxoacyl-[acyl-carrier-protein] synthase 2 n=2 Tax=Anaerococcus TaxID=165779 RepID=A0ABX2N9V0_9FIRM|nr:MULTISPECIES: beta-ketoacyl-ACP synthase II [Anaerococcus]MSS78325.1 beta-ketoacyl-ACP synthase II [Anaerococcus porci]NVF11439.1 beta-ketoacyl-ACP synthase II [Anaerococcus faecalis]